METLTQQQILQLLEEHLDKDAYDQTFLQEIEHRFAKQPGAGLSDVLYLLDEKIYDLLAWARRHEELGMPEKARQEEAKAASLQTCAALLQPYAPKAPVPPAGTI